MLTRPRNRSSERQTGDVAAGDEQDAANRPEDREEDRPRGADDVVDQRRGVDAPARVRVRPSLLLESCQAIELRVCLLDGRARCQAAHGVEKPCAPWQIRGVERDGNPEIDGLAVRKRALTSTDMLQARRDDADHLEWPSRQVDGASDDRRIGAEPRAPDAIAQDHAIDAARPFVLFSKRPAERSPRAEELEVSSRHEQAFEILRACRSPELVAFAIESGDARKGLGLLAKRVEVSRRQRHIDESRMLREDAHERVRVGVGQRFQQHAADDAVDGGVASDGQAERQDDNGRERRVLREAPRRPPVLAPDLRQPLAGAGPLSSPESRMVEMSLTELTGVRPGSDPDVGRVRSSGARGRIPKTSYNTQHMPRPHRSVAGFCVVVIVLAAFLPGFCALDYALFEPQWVLLPDEVVVAVDSPLVPVDEQPVSLLSLVSSRGPPSRPLA